ncbi:protein NYNRIN-like [Microcaecilia unicolor]|uniref:Protein NYNRIN-like n=1 Tax=Microcaecilia unicolor TaxID=1415580 RepID=A0A6P7XBT2_9AMPH|nr:protein NYNRIN-like [Microcaecilia unicolor]
MDPVARGNQRADDAAKRASQLPHSSDPVLFVHLPTEAPIYGQQETEWAQQEGLESRNGWWILQDGRIWIPEALAWTVVREAHNRTHLGRDALGRLLEKTYYVNKLSLWTKNASSQCTTCARNNPRTGPGPAPGHILRGTSPFHVCQIDFTHMPPAWGYKAVLLAVCTYIGWIEAVPTRTEMAKEVTSLLIHHILPRYGLPKQINSDNGPAFASEVTQQLGESQPIPEEPAC